MFGSLLVPAAAKLAGSSSFNTKILESTLFWLLQVYTPCSQDSLLRHENTFTIFYAELHLIRFPSVKAVLPPHCNTLTDNYNFPFHIYTQNSNAKNAIVVELGHRKACVLNGTASLLQGEKSFVVSKLLRLGENDRPQLHWYYKECRNCQNTSVVMTFVLYGWALCMEVLMDIDHDNCTKKEFN